MTIYHSENKVYHEVGYVPGTTTDVDLNLAQSVPGVIGWPTIGRDSSGGDILLFNGSYTNLSTPTAYIQIEVTYPEWPNLLPEAPNYIAVSGVFASTTSLAEDPRFTAA
jgi:hypothetical protein